LCCADERFTGYTLWVRAVPGAVYAIALASIKLDRQTTMILVSEIDEEPSWCIGYAAWGKVNSRVRDDSLVDRADKTCNPAEEQHVGRC
jgi:hypothetical protein